ncbi:MAG: AI-2E family transporter, partial [Chloroflexota bacterium]|nr:AI-2E family transporter [Chloroflexota bacterium]
MAEPVIRENAEEAARTGSPMETPLAAAFRTPRWVWAWTLPLVLLLMLYLSRRILGPFIIAAVLAYIFSLVIDQIQERLRWPRWVIVTGLYVLVLGLIGVGLYFGAEALYRQTREFILGGPEIVERGLTQVLGGNRYTFGGQVVDAHFIAQQVSAGIAAAFGGGGDALHFVGEVVVRLLDTVLVIIVSFYLMLDGKRMATYFLKFVPSESRARTGYIAGRIHTVLGAYLRGQLLLIGLMSLVSFVVLQFIFQVPYALPLGILTGFLEILPLVGPAMAAALASG